MSSRATHLTRASKHESSRANDFDKEGRFDHEGDGDNLEILGQNHPADLSRALSLRFVPDYVTTKGLVRCNSNLEA